MRTLMIGLAALLLAAETAKEPAKETGETKPPASAPVAVDSYAEVKAKIEAQTTLMTADAVSKLTIEQLKAIDAKASERVLLIAQQEITEAKRNAALKAILDTAIINIKTVCPNAAYRIEQRQIVITLEKED
mgnify:FL=1